MPLLRYLSRCLALLLAQGMALPATAQTRVENTATLTYRSGDADTAVRSNRVSIDVAAARQPSTITIRSAPPGFDF